MNNQNCLTSACRYCRFYQPDGLHRGNCDQLNVTVRSDWKACQLALPAFANTWENAEELTTAIPQEELMPIAVGTQLARQESYLNNSYANVNN